ncbi:MAG: GYDIA family GHMP kinase [Prolixibacteraceae bacterium]|jgi:mevalonate kinase|nr:GYDIA family GHMP kinase [Prolixibacteraceae bacterium]
MQSFHSNGKLMLTGEYLVLKGAQALALPARFGQDMKVEANSENCIHWTSTIKNEPWTEVVFSLQGIEVLSTNNKPIAQRLQQVLQAAQKLNSSFLSSTQGVSVHSNIGFDIEWGLGFSSSMVSNIASWAGCDAFELNRLTFGGSDYDIACARTNAPILYQIQNNKPQYRIITFDPPFKNRLYFVWLNRKQNTREGIDAFDKSGDYTDEVIKLNAITNKMLACIDEDVFMDLIHAHEKLISDVIKLEPVKQRLFSDFPGTVKSLGAWGGDFVLVASEINENDVFAYFEKKGFATIVRYSDMMLVNA